MGLSMTERACRICKRINEGNECEVCKSNDLTSSWKGVIVVVSPESEIAKKAGIAVPGKYALQVI